jgi:hypothetical protein
MKRYLCAFLALVAALAAEPLFSLDGTVVTVNGKVEFLDGSGSWKALKAGDPLASGTMISTGFKSEATVRLGASILTVKPLTRMTLTQLVEKEDTVNTEVYLEVGNVKAEVNSLNSKKNGFTVKSPAATASVRGTVFEIGDNLVIIEGTVAYSTPLGQNRDGTAGQKLELVGESITSPATALQAGMEPIRLSETPSTEVKSPITATLTSPQPSVPEVTAASAIPGTNTPTTLILSLE